MTHEWERPVKSSRGPGHLGSLGACLVPGLPGQGVPQEGSVCSPGCGMETALPMDGEQPWQLPALRSPAGDCRPLARPPASPFLTAPATEGSGREPGTSCWPRARGFAGARESGNVTDYCYYLLGIPPEHSKLLVL